MIIITLRELIGLAIVGLGFLALACAVIHDAGSRWLKRRRDARIYGKEKGRG